MDLVAKQRGTIIIVLFKVSMCKGMLAMCICEFGLMEKNVVDG
jgi:hypothetical protein